MSSESPKKPLESPEPVAAADDTTQAGAETPPAPDPAITADSGSPADAAQPTPTVESLQTQLAESQDRQLRLQAELENVRKRMLRTLDEEKRYACLPLMRDLLPVMDNLQRAIQAAEQHEHTASLLEGVRLVATQLEGVLQRHHCAPIDAHGAPFDPHLHEAIAQLPNDEHAPGHVCLVTQTGYQLHDRVVRPSQVIVAAPRPATPEDENTEEPHETGS